MKKLVIANRGEIARRILRTALDLQFEVGILVAPGDSDGVALQFVPEKNRIEVPSYLDARAVVQACKNWGAGYLHPGYGFLSENADFAEQVEAASIVFVGPTAQQMRALGDKENSKKLALRLGVPVLNAAYSDDLKSSGSDLAKYLLEKGIPGPWLVKASGGGGGRGMRIVRQATELSEAVSMASREALAGFGNPAVFIERYLESARHIEVQVFGDGNGGGVALGERECSLQRRHQKVIEEAPSPVVETGFRKQLCTAALRFVQETKYRGAGTVEFLVSKDLSFAFLEMNTRLQVEHPVTEEVYGIDLVKCQLELADGRWNAGLGNAAQLEIRHPSRHAIEVRVLAEDPLDAFRPTPGRLVAYREPGSSFGFETMGGASRCRMESGLCTGARVNPNYDSMVAKVIATGHTREQAIQNLSQSLPEFVVSGFHTNIDFLQALVSLPEFKQAHFDTRWLESNLELCFSQCLRPALEDLLTPLPVARQILSVLYGSGLGTSSGVATNSGLALGAVSDSAFFTSFPESPQKLQTHFLVRREAPCSLSAGPAQLSGTTLYLSGNLVAQWAGKLRDSGQFKRVGLVQWLAGLCRGDEMRCIASYRNNSLLYLNVMGVDLCVDIKKAERLEGSETSDSSELCAPMPGKIVKIKTAQGAQVSVGQVLFVMESMKMQIEIKSSRAGRLAEILISEEQAVEAGSLLGRVADE